MAETYEWHIGQSGVRQALLGTCKSTRADNVCLVDCILWRQLFTSSPFPDYCCINEERCGVRQVKHRSLVHVREIRVYRRGKWSSKKENYLWEPKFIKAGMSYRVNWGKGGGGGGLFPETFLTIQASHSCRYFNRNDFDKFTWHCSHTVRCF